MTDDTLLEQIRLWARELGFQQIGVSDIDVTEHAAHLQHWLDNQYHADMDWMAQHARLRAHPEQLHPGTLRIISVRMDYLPHEEKDLIAKIAPDGNAYIARYALGRDYHKLMRKRLAQLAQKIETHTLHKHRAFVDSAPVLERAFAQKSGLGWIGKNTMLINSTAGSYFFLGEILTDLPLPVTASQDTQHCGTCTACLDLCPTQAFVAPHQLDARRCISYLTIENKNSIPEAFRTKIGNRIFGCDDCQAVCPWNKFAQRTEQEDFLPRHALDNAQLVELFLWSEEEYLQKTEGSALRRIGHEGWLRNIAVALGNADSTPDIIAALEQRRHCPSELVREHVEWALEQHAGHAAYITGSF
jgi:epoxyqueuosine reductase